MKQQWQKNDELLKAMIIVLFTHHSFDMLKLTVLHQFGHVPKLITGGRLFNC